MDFKVRLFDRSRSTTDWDCERKRYMAYEMDGRGITTDRVSLPLYEGTCIHDGLAAMAHQQLEGRVDIDLISRAAHDQMFTALMEQAEGQIDGETFAHEQATLVEGLLRGYYRHLWPRLMAQYQIKLIEPEVTYKHDGLVFMARPDLIVEDKHDQNQMVFVEYKSTSSKKESWINSWSTAVQLHSTIKAIEATLQEKVSGVQVVGLYKGYESYGKQNSVFCYAYKRLGTPPFSVDQVSYEYKQGFKRSPVWELEGGCQRWVAEMPEAILQDQFPCTPLIFINEDLVDAFFKQRAMREMEIDMAMVMMKGADEKAKEAILNTAFEQNFSACSPAWGSGCEFKRICHGHVTNPLESGFRPRDAHHQLEIDQWKGAEADSPI